MKKKYFAPEMEEVELDEPIVLSEEQTSGGNSDLCTSNTCGAFTAPE